MRRTGAIESGEVALFRPSFAKATEGFAWLVAALHKVAPKAFFCF
jgi:hypothetical protein